MIGQRIESRQGLPWGPLAFAAIGLAMLGCGFALGLPPLLLGSALPIGIAFGLLIFGLERPFAAVIHEDTIEVEGPQGTIPYAALRDVRAAGISHDPSTYRKKSVPIQVEHEGGTLPIPSRLNVPSHEVYHFLSGRVPPGGDRLVNPSLVDYLERQEGYYGPEHVWTYRAIGRRSRAGRFRRFRAFCAGLGLAGVAWMVAGFSGWVDTGWGGAGIMCALVGLCFYLVTLANHAGAGQTIRNWKKASLVIGPQGMAMVQGEIEGEVRWPELLDVKFRPKASSFRLSYDQGLNGIILKVKGAEIRIADIYDRPLYVIYDRILDCSGRSVAEEIVDL